MTTESSDEIDVPEQFPYKALAGAYHLAMIGVGSTYERTTGIRASGLGMCARRQLYKLVEFPEGEKEPTTFKSLASMRFGTVIGEDIENLAAVMINDMAEEAAGEESTKWHAVAQVEVKGDMQFADTVVQMVAHPDMLIVNVEDGKLKHVHVIDIKTTNPNGHRMVEKEGGSEHHKYQVGMAMFLIENIDMGKLFGKVEGFTMKIDDATDFKVTGELFYISRAFGDYFSVPVDQVYAELAENRCALLMEHIHDRTDPGPVPVKDWECNYCDFKPGCKFSNINPFSLPFTADANITKDQ